MPEEVNSWQGRQETPPCTWGIRCLLFTYRLLGRRVARWMAALVLLFVYPFLGQARRASAEYRQQWAAHTGRKFPGGGFRHICRFCYAMLDRLACWGGVFPQERINDCTPDAVKRVTDDFREGRGSFFIISHLGNAELLRAIFRPLAVQCNRCIHVYLDIDLGKGFASVVESVNADSGMHLHSTQELGVGGCIFLAEAVERGDLVIMAGDRTVRTGGRASSTFEFLGRPAHFPLGTFRLAAALGCPVYSLFLVADGSRYDLHVHALSDGNAKASGLQQAFLHRMEGFCGRYPEEWFNFYPFWG